MATVRSDSLYCIICADIQPEENLVRCWLRVQPRSCINLAGVSVLRCLCRYSPTPETVRWQACSSRPKNTSTSLFLSSAKLWPLTPLTSLAILILSDPGRYGVASSRMTWLLVPPYPKLLIEARRGSLPVVGHASSSVATLSPSEAGLGIVKVLWKPPRSYFVWLLGILALLSMLSALIRLTCLTLPQSRVGVRPNSYLSSHILVAHSRRSREAGKQYLAIATYPGH